VLVGYLFGRQRAIGSVPGRDAVERGEHCHRREFGVDLPKGTDGRSISDDTHRPPIL